jgi:hypothetical protein
VRPRDFCGLTNLGRQQAASRGALVQFHITVKNHWQQKAGFSCICAGSYRHNSTEQLFCGRSYWIPGSYAATLSENHDSFLRLLKDNDFKEERMTKVRLYAISTSTTLESNKSDDRKVQ